MLRKSCLLLSRNLQAAQTSSDVLQRLGVSCSSIHSSHSLCLSWREFAKPARQAEEEDDFTHASERVQRLAEEIMHLNLLEVADLTDILQKRLGLNSGMGAMPYGMMQPGVAQGPADTSAAPPAEEKAPEQTEFDVKLEGFEAASKLKLVKELKACIPELSLKEAKEQVDKAPNVLRTGLSKDEAEELMKKLEAVGAKIALI